MPTGKIKRPYGRYSEAQIRQALTVAIANTRDGCPNFRAGQRAIGAPAKRSVEVWYNKYTAMVAEITALHQAKLKEIAPALIDVLLENANLAAQEWNRRLKNNTGQIKDFALTGILDYSIKNAQLLQGKPTGNVKVSEDLKAEVIHKITEVRQEMSKGSEVNRISGYLGANG